MSNVPGPPFGKQLPGADCVFQPDDIGDYENDEWDIRISIGAPAAAAAALDFKGKVTLNEGLRLTADWMQNGSQ